MGPGRSIHLFGRTDGVASDTVPCAATAPEAADNARLVGVRGVLFDLPGVLYDATLWRRWLWQLVTRMGVESDLETFYRPWDARFVVDVHCGRRARTEAFEAFLLAAGLTRGQAHEVEAASAARRRVWETLARPLPGVREAVVRLRAGGYVLGVLSNSEYPAELLRARLARFVPADAVTAVVSSCDLECAKPDVRCYRAALAALSLHSEQTAFVGCVDAELAAARALGLVTVALNRPESVAAEIHLEAFAELPDRLPACVRQAVAG